MIAQVRDTSGRPGSALEGAQKTAGDAARNQRAVDGCEGIYMFGDTTTGQVISFVLWRDEAAMQADLARQEKDLAAAKELDPSITISEGRIYQIFGQA
jgi:hypothetical protein